MVIIKLQRRSESYRSRVQKLSRRCVIRKEAGLPVCPDPSIQTTTFLKANVLKHELELSSVKQRIHYFSNLLVSVIV